MIVDKIVITEPTCSDEEWQIRRREILKSESKRIKFNSKNISTEEDEQEIGNLKLTLAILKQTEPFEYTHLDEDVSFYIKKT
jgi:hypothetical protein